MKGVNIFLADGFEEVEALATRDVLVRGGVDVKLVGINAAAFVVSSHKVKVGVDLTLEDIDTSMSAEASDVMIFPGGMPGSKNLGECRRLVEMMNEHYRQGGAVAAICAAPSFVLGQLDGMQSATFTCYDSCEDNLVEMGAKFVRRPAVTCGRIITGRGPGHSIDFGLAILRYLKGDAAADYVADGMILPISTE